MKKTLTLKKNYEFRYVLTKGSYIGGRYIEAFVTKNKKDVNNIGIAISVKIAKAVKRNRIKRLIKECYRLQEDDIKKGYNIVFLWKKKKDIINATYLNIERDMKEIIQKINVL